MEVFRVVGAARSSNLRSGELEVMRWFFLTWFWTRERYDF